MDTGNKKTASTNAGRNGMRVSPTRYQAAGRVQRMQIREILGSSGVQSKLTIGAPNDKYEQEADRVADEVMRMPEVDVQRQENPEEENEEEVQRMPLSNRSPPQIQRLCSECQEEFKKTTVAGAENGEEEVQTKSLSDGTEHMPNVSPEIRSLNGGRQLSLSEREFYEPRFGRDFSQTRIHVDARANWLARSVNARAFTYGQNVVFGAGEYRPESHEGRRLIAHELTHVVQQGHAQGDDSISRAPIQVQRAVGCLYPTYPGMGGLTQGNHTWYPHDFVGPLQSGDVRATSSSSGYGVPGSASSNYNCMRWAVGHGVPSTREWWQGVTRSSSVPWPEETYLQNNKGCSRISSTTSADHKVKLYEYKNQDQFHIVRQEADGAWSSKTGTGQLYRGITSPDTHTAGHYVPMSQMRPSYWSCP